MELHFEEISLYFQSRPMKSLKLTASFLLAIFLNSGTALGSGGAPMITGLTACFELELLLKSNWNGCS